MLEVSLKMWLIKFYKIIVIEYPLIMKFHLSNVKNIVKMFVACVKKKIFSFFNKFNMN